MVRAELRRNESQRQLMTRFQKTQRRPAQTMVYIEKRTPKIREEKSCLAQEKAEKSSKSKNK